MRLFKKRFFSREEEKVIVEAIRRAELATSGEIRVHVHTSKCKQSPMAEATDAFARLNMDKTALRNGVLFYLAPRPKAFIILGDEGIDKVVPEDFWENTKNLMQEHFREGNFVEGLQDGILLAGNQLKEHFPYEANDENELPDEISYD